jgi:plasmid stabilization system protein ParE
MNFHVVVYPQAEEDIDRNTEWWAKHHSATQAQKWHQAIYDAIYDLDKFPESHSLAPENPEFPYELRELHCGLGSRPSYRAVFTIKRNEVHVLTVQRATQDRLHSDDVTFDD